MIVESRALRVVGGTTNAVERSGLQRDAAEPHFLAIERESWAHEDWPPDDGGAEAFRKALEAVIRIASARNQETWGPLPDV